MDSCLTNVLATVADVVGAKLADNAGEDSFSFLPVITGSGKSARDAAVHHSINGVFAIRQGPWNLELCAGSGGWSTPRDPQAVQQGRPDTQLYRIGEGDLAEQKNVAKENPEVVTRLTHLLEKYVANGRSTPGTPQKNAVEVVLRKPIPAKAGGKR